MVKPKAAPKLPAIPKFNPNLTANERAVVVDSFARRFARAAMVAEGIDLARVDQARTEDAVKVKLLSRWLETVAPAKDAAP